jgi:hypothetical protein
MSADNQQERLNAYIAGFVDGEGSFHIAIQKTLHVKFGYQLVPEFHVSQNLDYANVLNLIKLRLDCGYIKPNHAKDLHDHSYVFVVRNRNDLLRKVIPFFNTNQLYSPKQKDFEKFAYIVNAMSKNVHTTYDGFMELIHVAYTMNRNGQYRKIKLEHIVEHLKSSTTIR